MTSQTTDSRLRLKGLIAAGEARLLPLTFSQRELWENSPVVPGDPANHICATIDIRGLFSFDLCEEALRAVVERQEALRTTFLSGAEKTAQVVVAKAETTLRSRDVRPDQLDDLMAEVFSEPLDMVRGPLYRIEMLRVAADHHVLALAFHHAIADGWTLGVFVEDFTTAYILALRQSGRAFAHIQGTRGSLPPPGLTYSAAAADERARWQSDEIEHEAAYWRERLAGSTLLFGDTSDDSPMEPLLKRVSALPPALVDASRDMARRAEVTLFSVLLTVFQIALYRWRGIADVVLGVPYANRMKTQSRDTMGYFAGVVPLRMRLETGRSFAATLTANHAAQIEDFAHAMPFVELAKAVLNPRSPHRHQVFDVRFALQNHPIPDIELPGISTRLRTISTGTSRFDIGCELTEDREALEVVWLYRPRLVRSEDVEFLDQLFASVLGEAGQNPNFRPG